ncbi:DUF805 domain-containing protein [Alcaligenaceae bacterium]|nr:DUF805 domain-containing protein [Alcaligenaceae bacterium]
MNFGTAISTCLSKYANFTGRATRSEYWWFYLFVVLVTWGASLVAGETFSTIVSLAFTLPVFAVGARRLHDTGRSGWWQLLILTIIGLIPLVIWLASDSKKEDPEHSFANS